ncbi:hypothetical protein FQZ97_1048070 [compost metagenome]
MITLKTAVSGLMLTLMCDHLSAKQTDTNDRLSFRQSLYPNNYPQNLSRQAETDSSVSLSGNEMKPAFPEPIRLNLSSENIFEAPLHQRPLLLKSSYLNRDHKIDLKLNSGKSNL